MRNLIIRTTIWMVLAVPAGLMLSTPAGGLLAARHVHTSRLSAGVLSHVHVCLSRDHGDCPGSCGGTCGTCSAVPQTSYRSVLSPVPVTTFQPVQVGAGTYLQPCATTSYQVQRTPVSNFLAMPTWTTPATTGCSSCGYAPTTSAYSPTSSCATCSSYAPSLSGYASPSQFAPSSSCDCNAATGGSTYASPYAVDSSGVSATPWTPVDPSEANGLGTPGTDSVPADVRPNLSQPMSSSSPSASSYQRPTVSYTDTGYAAPAVGASRPNTLGNDAPPAPWYPPQRADQAAATSSMESAPPFRPIPDPRPHRPRVELSSEPDSIERNLFPSRGELHTAARPQLYTAARPTTRFEAVPIRWEINPRRPSSDDVGNWRSLAE